MGVGRDEHLVAEGVEADLHRRDGDAEQGVRFLFQIGFVGRIGIQIDRLSFQPEAVAGLEAAVGHFVGEDRLLDEVLDDVQEGAHEDELAAGGVVHACHRHADDLEGLLELVFLAFFAALGEGQVGDAFLLEEGEEIVV